MLKNGYESHPEKYFSFIKHLSINNIQYDIDVDLLAGIYGGTQKKKKSQHVQCIKALKATGGNFAFKFIPQRVKVESIRPDGAIDFAHINVIAVVPYLVMKVAALGRGKAKDAYDIYFIIKHYHGGINKLANEFEGFGNKNLVINMKEKLAEKFASESHSGSIDVINFLDLRDTEEKQLICRDVYEQVKEFLSKI